MSTRTASRNNAAYVSYPLDPPSATAPNPPTAPRRGRRGLWIGLGLGATLAILLAGGVAIAVVPRLMALAAPFDTAKAFCNDLAAQHYDAAYALLTPAFQAQITRDQLVQDSRANDARDGRIQTCGEAKHGDIAPSQISFSLGDTRAQFTYVFSRSKRDFVGLIALVKSGGVWRIDGMDTSLLDLPR